jgi:plasmid stabilization system protein ParE
MRLTFLLRSELDIQRAYERYKKFSEGRGDAFIAYLEDAFLRIEKFPFVALLHFENYRRLVLRDFPYGIFYVVESNQVVIHALMDLRQDPLIIFRRLLNEL